MEMAELTKRIAQEIADKDPELKDAEHKGLKNEVTRLFGKNGDNSYN